MSRSKIINQIISQKVVAVLRLDNQDDILPTVDAVVRGGISSIEITMTTPGGLKIIEQINKRFTDNILVGAGSVLTPKDAHDAIIAGAKYIVSPVFNPEIIKMAHYNELPAMPGCFSPTEIYNAYSCGADIIKVFPANITGMNFFKSILGPMPFLKLMPTGGVTLNNAGKWLNAGACAVGVGSSLIDKTAISKKDFTKIKNNAELLIENIKL